MSSNNGFSTSIKVESINYFSFSFERGISKLLHDKESLNSLKNFYIYFVYILIF